MAAFLQLIPLTGVPTNFQFFSVEGTFNLYLGVSTGTRVHLCMCVEPGDSLQELVLAYHCMALEMGHGVTGLVAC